MSGRNDSRLEEVCANEYHKFFDASPTTENAFRADYFPKEPRKPKTYVREFKTFREN
jgi:hypothetical protein